MTGGCWWSRRTGAGCGRIPNTRPSAMASPIRRARSSRLLARHMFHVERREFGAVHAALGAVPARRRGVGEAGPCGVAVALCRARDRGGGEGPGLRHAGGGGGGGAPGAGAGLRGRPRPPAVASVPRVLRRPGCGARKPVADAGGHNLGPQSTDSGHRSTGQQHHPGHVAQPLRRYHDGGRDERARASSRYPDHAPTLDCVETATI